MKLSKDGWTGLAVLAASLALFALTLDLKPSPLVPIGPGFYPRLVMGLAAILAAVLVVADALAQKRAVPAAPAAEAAKADYGSVIAQFALFGLYAAALPSLGFRIATFAYVAAANALMAPPSGWRQWARVAAIALGTTAATYYAFEHYLSVLLPRGRWTDF